MIKGSNSTGLNSIVKDLKLEKVMLYSLFSNFVEIFSFLTFLNTNSKNWFINVYFNDRCIFGWKSTDKLFFI